MRWDEPRTIATRLARVLGVALREDPAEDGGGVLLVDADVLDTVSDRALRDCAALVATDRAAAASSRALGALRDATVARGLVPALATFATLGDDDGVRELPLVVAAPAGATRVPELLAAGPHALALDPVALAPDATDGPPARVCIVSFEAAGMTGGGIGTASSALAETLARAGHDVTLLFTGWQERGASDDNAAWRERHAARGIRLAFVREPGARSVQSPHFPTRSAYEVYCWLREQPPFDVVHVPENMGQGAFAQLAKRQGTDFAATTFVVGTHGPTRWAAEANRVALTHEELLVNDGLERVSVALADVLLGPSRYLHDHLRERGWELPERVHVQPYATPAAVRDGRTTPSDAPATAATELPHEVIFFGRVETRKGVVTLCDALELLAGGDGPVPAAVTFLGPLAQVLGEPADAYVARRAERWPWPCRTLPDLDQDGAAAYLARPGVLAVMPSLVDNAPNTVSEAVALGIPLVASRAGGTGELVDALQRDDHTFGTAAGGPLPPRPLHEPAAPADPRPLAELLRRRLAEPVAPARPPFEPSAVDAAYDRWHRAVRAAAAAAPAASAAATLPSLSACLLYDGDEALLSAQLAALPGDAEVVVADVRATREPPVPTGGRTVAIVQPATPGHQAQARAAAAAATHGELLAVVPAADVPLPGFAETLRRIAARRDADVLACATLDGTASGGADDGVDPRRAFVPIAGPAVAGLSHHAFAVGPYAIRRSALERLGGWSADAAGDVADHALLAGAVAAGLKLEVVPHPLATKRRPDGWSRHRAAPPGEPLASPYDAAEWVDVERALAAGPDAPPVPDLVALLRGARGEAHELRRRLGELQDAYEQRVAEQRTWIENLELTATVLRDEVALLRSQFVRLRALRSAVGRARRRLLSVRRP